MLRLLLKCLKGKLSLIKGPFFFRSFYAFLFSIQLLVSCFVYAESTLLEGAGLYSQLESSSNYLLYIPKHHKRSLIVTLHGSGERADLFIDHWKKGADKFKIPVLAINANDKRGWSGEDIPRVLRVVQEVKRDLKIDHTLLNGSSSGGHFALFIGINNYFLFDGVATFMGLATTELGKHITYQDDPAKRIPLLLIHGKKDAVIPIQHARRNEAYLYNRGYRATYWEEPEMVHEFYEQNVTRILRWFQKLSKK
jgi:predicted esterase